MAKITVKTAIPNHVGLWERNPLHPNGEIWVGDTPVTVETTPAVEDALRAGRIVKIEDAPKRTARTRKKKE